MKVGFVGLGMQGKGLAVNAAQAGFEVGVFDLNAAACSELAALGATVARSNAELARDSRIVQVCVLNDAQVQAVIAGPGGLLEGAEPGLVIAVHSTVRPDTVLALADAAKARGVELIDAAISGGAIGAAAKRMSFMVGGPAHALESCRKLFMASGSQITHTGPLGSGMTAKLAHQVVIAINMLAAHEGMQLGTKAGVPAPLLEQVVREGVAQSVVANHWSTLYIGAQAPRVFFKDLQLCLDLGRSLGLSMPGTALCQQLLDSMLADHLVAPHALATAATAATAAASTEPAAAKVPA